MARSFNGSSAIINVGQPAILDITGTVTLSIWANAVTLPLASTTYNVLMEKGWDGTNEQLIMRYGGTQLSGASGSRLQIFTYNIASAHGCEWIYTNTTGVWYHIAGSWNGSVWTLYNNGVSVGTTGGTQVAPIHSGADFTIGGAMISGSPARWFDGSLADAAVWNVALTANEIASLAKGRRPRSIRPASLIGYWPIDGISSPEPDLSGYANNGTLTATARANGPPMTMFTPRWPRNYEAPAVSLTQSHFRFRTDTNAVDATPTWGANEDAA